MFTISDRAIYLDPIYSKLLLPQCLRIRWTRLYLLASPQKRRNSSPSTLTHDYATARRNAMANSRVSSAFGGAPICRLSIFGVVMRRVKCPHSHPTWIIDSDRGNREDSRPCQCPACAHPARRALTFVFVRRLQELVLDQNLLNVLPATLWELGFLRVLKVASNRLALPPDKIVDMRALVLSVSFCDYLVVLLVWWYLDDCVTCQSFIKVVILK